MVNPKGSFFVTIIFMVLIMGIILGMVGGLYITKGVPEVESLVYNLPMETTKVYAKDGTLLQEYGVEKRILVNYNEISPKFFEALIAVEDENFYKHHGISFKGVLRAIISDIIHRKAKQGGSTITMQLARQYFLTPEKTIIRKIREIILALKIERRYSKQQILEMYANKVCFGNGYYGIEAASRYYFGKKALNLDTEEAAFLAGIIQRPAYYSPKKDLKRAEGRRNWVLFRMFKTGKIGEKEYKSLINKPLKLHKSVTEKGFGAYPAERVRIYLESKYGEEEIYEKGLRVYTTIDPKLQYVATKAVKEGLREYQRRRPFKKKNYEKNEVDSIKDFVEGESYFAKVEEVSKEEVKIGFKDGSFLLGKDNFKYFPNITPSIVFKEGDLILINVSKKEPLELQLDLPPEAQSALLSLNVKSGEVYAMVGGSDFSETMFNRVIQARRQTGSAVKPLIYAVAFRDSKNLSDIEIDTPTLFLYGTESPSEICSKGYIPHDFEKGFLGAISLRRAIEHSVNICAVRVLNDIGYQKVIEFMKKLHITTDLKPYPSMALGAFEITLWELTSAYGAFANNGVYVTPHFIQRIEDRSGRVLETFSPNYEDVLDKNSNFILISAMKGVVKRGTASSAANMKGNFAGKTGTTDDYTDAWFIGFNPTIVTGVWVGRDDHKTLGSLETGSRAALPIWRKFMEVATAGQEMDDWKIPEDIVFIPVCADTGLRVGMDSPCNNVYDEPFLKGREVMKVCTQLDHIKFSLPHFMQRYKLVRKDKIKIPQGDLDEFLAYYPSIVERISKDKISINWGGEKKIFEVEILPKRSEKPLEAVFDNLPKEGEIKCGAEVRYVHKR